jgi:hypothetical protein
MKYNVPVRRVTVTLSEDDFKLLGDLTLRAGAYNYSETVRNALRLYYQKSLISGGAPRVSEERIP